MPYLWREALCQCHYISWDRQRTGPFGGEHSVSAIEDNLEAHLLMVCKGVTTSSSTRAVVHNSASALSSRPCSPPTQP
jgi:hypothetical protein